MELLHSDPLTYLSGKNNPYPALVELFRERPVQFFPSQYWVVASHAESRQVSLDHENFSVKCRNRIAPYLLGMDPPEHKQARQQISALFSKANVSYLSECAQEQAKTLSTGFGGDPFDFVERFAFALPARVIGHILGIEEGQQPQFEQWIKFLTFAPSGINKQLISFSHFDRVVSKIDAFFQARLEEYATSGKARPLFYQWHFDQDEADRLPPEKLSAWARALMFAGVATTTGFLANSLLAFHRFPECWQSAKEDRSQLTPILEESLRFEAPVFHSAQDSTREIEVGGVLIPPQQRIIVLYGMANRDPQVFENPHAFNPWRKEAGKHLSFGYGAHACLGGMLARKIAHAAFSVLLERFRDFEVTVETDQVEWLATSYLRRPVSLPVRVSR